MPRVRIATGCHPHNAKHYDDALEAVLRERLADPRTAAVGEIGLDVHYDFSPRDDQRSAFRRQLRVAKEGGSLMPPKTILNAPTRLMKQEGYGADYAYDHDAPDAFSGQNYWPDALGRQVFYDPPERGFEREIRKRLEYWEKLRSARAE